MPERTRQVREVKGVDSLVEALQKEGGERFAHWPKVVDLNITGSEDLEIRAEEIPPGWVEVRPISGTLKGVTAFDASYCKIIYSGNLDGGYGAILEVRDPVMSMDFSEVTRKPHIVLVKIYTSQ